MAIETLLARIHEKRGAQLGEWFGCLLPERFDDFSGEYRRARDSVALVDKSYRSWMHFTGPDRVRYLNAILTNNIRDLAAGDSLPSLLLNAQGHILAELEAWALAESILCVSYAVIRERLAAEFDKYIIMDDVTLEDRTTETGCLGIEGPRAADVFQQVTAAPLNSLREREHREVRIAGIRCRILRRSVGNAPGGEFVAEPDALPALWHILEEATRQHGGGPIGYAALNALRVEAGFPWFTYDFDETTLPQEVGIEATHVSFTKGCYVGQEIVERIRSRGHVNRRLVGLEFSASSAPARGAKLFADGKEAGHVTRTAFSPRLARLIGMGYLRRESATPGTQVSAGGATAIVRELPFVKSQELQRNG